ncbi:MAG: efflux RND transporter periplasmic adaptor subunit [Betaproteobacteria bacterium]|nr:efflux RND transporter periplasmic adaptor subunit [Betaproteobacteria bacterium]
MSRATFLASLLFALLAACSREPEPPRPAAVRVEGNIAILADPEAAGFLSLAAAERDRGGMLRLPGRLVWNDERTARVTPQVAGRVQRVAVDLGETVKSGDALATLGSPDYGQARADARKATADVRVAEQALARARTLREAGIVAEKDWEQSEAAAASARAEAERAGRRLAMLGGDGDGSYVLRSPLTGVVVERNIGPGTEFRPEQGGPPLFVITDPTRLWLLLDAGEGDVAALKPGESISFEARNYPGERFAGVIRRVADLIDPTTRTIKVRAEVDNPDRRLKGEMFVHALVEVPPAAAVRVPVNAVFLVGSRHYVFVAEGNGRFRRQPVEAGNSRDGLVEVRSGVREGEQVVVEGTLNLLKFFKADAPQ